jgi:RNA polymerase sigma-70 factor (ECF subfamily)
VIANAAGVHTYQGMKPYLFAVAYRMTGSASDAEDLVQDAWLRYLDAGSPKVNSLRAYLTTIVSRLALDHLKSARIQREQYVGEWLPEPVLTSEATLGPADIAVQREQVSIAFLTLLERLTAEQRVVYVLREGFDYSYDEIAGSVAKSPAACRQIFRRAKDRIQRADTISQTPPARQLAVLDQFVQAFAAGNAGEIMKLLAADAVWVSDGGGKRPAFPRPVFGIEGISRQLESVLQIWGSAPRRPHTVVDLNGMPTLILWNEEGIETVIALSVRDGAIAYIHGLRNPDKLRHLEESLKHASSVSTQTD